MPWSGVGRADGGDEAVKEGGRPISGAAPAGSASNGFLIEICEAFEGSGFDIPIASIGREAWSGGTAWFESLLLVALRISGENVSRKGDVVPG